MYISILTKRAINIMDWEGKDLTQPIICPESKPGIFTPIPPLLLSCLVMGGGLAIVVSVSLGS
jgi:hypothetical protein